jgi:Protein of unknown function (DUF4242)
MAARGMAKPTKVGPGPTRPMNDGGQPDIAFNRPRAYPRAIAILFAKEDHMPLRRFMIERDIPKVGSFEREQLKGAAATSNKALAELGPEIQWVESYVAGDKTFCVYLARDEAIIKRHAEISGFPATKITEIRKVIDPTTANG